MKFLHAVFLGQRRERYAGVKEAPANQWLATGALAALCVGFGLLAREIPLKWFVMPAAGEAGLAPAGSLGLYDPRLILLLFGLAFALGLIVFGLTRKTRSDEVYIGGNAPSEEFRVSGTEFYREITEMRPFKGIYAQAEKQTFDPYNLGSKATFGFSRLLQHQSSTLDRQQTNEFLSTINGQAAEQLRQVAAGIDAHMGCEPVAQAAGKVVHQGDVAEVVAPAPVDAMRLKGIAAIGGE